MKAPDFKLKFSEEAAALSEIILADDCPRRYIRRRAYQPVMTRSVITDSSARGFFTQEGREKIEFRRIFGRLKEPLYSVAALHFFAFPALFLLLGGIFVYYFASGEIYKPDGIWAGSLCGAVSLISLAGFIVFTVRWVRRNKYLERVFSYLGELYVLYDTEGNPCCVCIEDNVTRILYKRTLYKLKNGKIKTVTDPKKVYLEYLDLFPQSVLNMSAFVADRKKYALAPEPDSTVKQYIYVVANETYKRISLSANLNDEGTNYLWKFHKLLLDLDKNYGMQRIYSCAGKNFDKYITLATAQSSGARVYEELALSLKNLPQAQRILDETGFNGNIK